MKAKPTLEVLKVLQDNFEENIGVKMDEEQPIEMTLPDLIRSLDLDLDSIRLEYDYGTTLDTSFDIDPGDFIRFSEEDLKLGSMHGLINSLSNSKRAIDCQINKVLEIFGISYKNKNIRQKLELLQAMGMVAPRILRKVNIARNYLEHEFKMPEQEQVEDALDIAILFVNALDSVLNFPLGFFVDVPREDGLLDDEGRIEAKKSLEVSFSEMDKRFLLRAKLIEVDGEESNPLTRRIKVIGECIIEPNNPFFVEIVKLATLAQKNIGKFDRIPEAKELLSKLWAK